MRRAAKADQNQADLVESFRVRGAKVLHLHQVGEGCPDLLIGYRNRLALVEIKQPGEKLNAVQCVFHAEWGFQFPVFVVRTDEDVADVLTQMNE